MITFLTYRVLARNLWRMTVPFVVWIGIIRWRYPGGWAKAAVIGLVAWVSALLVLLLLNALFSLGIGASGVPGA